MNHVPIRLGPLALLLTVISICLTVLAILTFTTARADLSLAEQHAQTVRSRYVLEQQGQEFLATAQPGEAMDFELDGMHLTVALDENGAVSRWSLSKEWIQEGGIGGLWTGN